MYNVKPSVDLAVEALYDYWAFIEMIKFQGGIDNWDDCHFDYVLHLQAPQLYRAGRLTGDLLSRWERINRYTPTGPPSRNRMLKMPRGHRKSTLLVGYIMWRIWRNPNIRILHACNILDLSESFMREMRSYFEDAEMQEKFWNRRPHIKGKLIPDFNVSRARRMDTEAIDSKVVWNNEAIQVIRPGKFKEPTLAATSVGAKKTGHHVDVAIMDDVVDFDNSSSQGKIQKVKRWAGDVMSIVNDVIIEQEVGVLPDGTRVYDQMGDEKIVAGTHYDPVDYYTFLEREYVALDYNVFERNIYNNHIDNSDGYIMTGFTAEIEKRKRAELSELPGVFDAQYLNKVFSADLQVLNTMHVNWMNEGVLLEGREDNVISFRVGGSETIDAFTPIITVDPAISLNSRADDTAIIVGGWSRHGHLVFADAIAGHFTPSRTCDEIVRLAKKWGVRLAYVESVGFQELLRRQVLAAIQKANVQCSIVSYKPQGNKHKRIEYQLATSFARGKVIMASHLKHNPRVINPIDFFGKPTARDDVPDAMAVIAEKSIPPSEGGKLKKRYPWERPEVTDNEINPKYGGYY
jgi:predicted phage terminase large subunit-like protein